MERKNNDSKSLDAINIARRANGRKNMMKTIQSNQGTIALLFVQLSSRVHNLQRSLANCQYDLKYHTKDLAMPERTYELQVRGKTKRKSGSIEPTHPPTYKQWSPFFSPFNVKPICQLAPPQKPTQK
jgi:hypothetical protein